MFAEAGVHFIPPDPASKQNIEVAFAGMRIEGTKGRIHKYFLITSCGRHYLALSSTCMTTVSCL